MSRKVGKSIVVGSWILALCALSPCAVAGVGRSSSSQASAEREPGNFARHRRRLLGGAAAFSVSAASGIGSAFVHSTTGNLIAALGCGESAIVGILVLAPSESRWKQYWNRDRGTASSGSSSSNPSSPSSPGSGRR
jgi:hypothetical protein